MSTTPKRAAAPARKTRSKAAVAAADSASTAPLTVSKADAEKREVLIRLAAYSFYERRGFIAGNELEDWLQAEMEVDRQMLAAPESDAAK